MNFELYIAKRLIFKKENNKRFASPVINIAILSISLSLAIMLIALCVLQGFQKEIRSKIAGVGAHIQISSLSRNNSFEFPPIMPSDSLVNELMKIKYIQGIYSFATKAAILKSGDELQGVVFKGLGHNYNWSFFKKNLIEGKILNDSLSGRNIIISQYLAQKLNLKTGESVYAYFVSSDKPVRVLNYTINGIYKTDIPDLDQKLVITDLKEVQKLNIWEQGEIGGYEVILKGGDKIFKADIFGNQPIDIAWEKVYASIGYNMDAKSLKHLFPQIFDWLKLQDVNVQVIIILMLLVGGINMISALLVLILDKIRMIGLLKAFGSENNKIVKIFLYSSFFIIGKGLFWGNIIGLIVCLIQWKSGIITLDPQSYYVSAVPVSFNISSIILLNLGSLISCFIILLLPSLMISKITPVKSIKFN